MAEKFPDTNHEAAEALTKALERHERHAAHKPEAAKAETAQERVERLAEARTQTQAEASTQNPLEHLQAAEKAEVQQPQFLTRGQKKTIARNELRGIRRKLPAADRALSKFIHQPVIRTVSETAAKTVSRPSGLLGGGLVALSGTTVYLYLAKHIGFEYNYVVFLVLFAGGFVLGLVLELAVHLATAGRRQQD